MSKQQLLADLIAAKALIDTPEKWTQGEYGVDAHGRPIFEGTWGKATPVCMCSIGALAQATGRDPVNVEKSEAATFLSTAAHGDNCEGAAAIVYYNDEHTHEEVMAVWDAAIAAAEKAVQIENLEILRDAVEAQPLTLFDLSHYQQKTACGTMFCTAGMATTIPHFQQQGFHMAVDDGSEHNMNGSFVGVKVGGDWIFDADVTLEYFGGGFDALFAPAGCGDLDDELGYEADFCADEAVVNMTDKELAIARLTYQIELLKEQE